MIYSESIGNLLRIYSAWEFRWDLECAQRSAPATIVMTGVKAQCFVGMGLPRSQTTTITTITR